MRRNQWIAIGAVAMAFLLAGGFLWFFFLGPAIAQAHIATGYMAKSVCSCLYVDNGTLEQCRTDALLDREPSIGKVSVKADSAHKSVRASFLPFSSDRAIYEEGSGCHLK